MLLRRSGHIRGRGRAAGRQKRFWSAGLRGDGVAIAICDNGVDSAEFDVIDGWSPVRSCPWGQEQQGWAKGHGSMCAHAALLSAPKAKILDVGILKYPNSNRNAWLSNAILGLNWIAQWSSNNPDYRVLISNSWACYRSLESDDQAGSYRESTDHPFNRRTSSLANQGFPIFFAAGNCGTPCPDIRCGASDRGPGSSIWGANSLESVVCVAAVDVNDNRIGYSSQGPGVLHSEKPESKRIRAVQGVHVRRCGNFNSCPSRYRSGRGTALESGLRLGGCPVRLDHHGRQGGLKRLGPRSWLGESLT